MTSFPTRILNRLRFYRPLICSLFIAITAIGVPFIQSTPAIALSGTWTAHGTSDGVAANQWRSVAYGNGLFVAVAATGTHRVMTSPDGITWTPRTVPANQWQSITYGGGKFVAVSADGAQQIMTSADGITWTAITAPLAVEWRAVTYGNGVFIAVAGEGTGTDRVMRSTDGGITWTKQSAAEANKWYAVSFGNGTFVAVTDNGTNRVMTSTDGITWTPRAAAQANGWYSVTYGHGTFVAVSYNGTNRVMTSTDGATWTARSASQAAMWVSVTYGNGEFAAVAWSTNTVMTSVDGSTWTSSTATESNVWNSIAYGDGVFVAVSDTGTNRVKRLDSRPQSLTNTMVSGLSADNLTSDNTPNVTTTGALNGYTVTVTASRTGHTDVSCTYIATAATSCDLGTLSDGTWSITSTQTSPGGAISVASSPLQITVDATSPTLTSSSFNQDGTEITLTFDESLHSTSATLNEYVLSVEGTPITASSITVVGNTLVVKLDTPLTAGQVVNVSYTAPARNGATTNSAIQDLLGNDSLSFTTNVTAPSLPASTPSPSTSGGSSTSTSSDTSTSSPSKNTTAANNSSKLPETGSSEMLSLFVTSILLIGLGVFIASRRRLI